MLNSGRLPTSLRISAEPYRFVSEAEVHAALVRDPSGYLQHLERSLAALAAKRWTMELPAKQVFDDGAGGGDFRVMPCIVRGSSVLKTVKVIGTNRRQELVPDQITVGKLLALDPVENFVTHVFEACLLSSARTGACAAVAISWLQRVRRRIVIVGAGRVGFYAGLYAHALGGVEEIVLCDRVAGRAEQVAHDLEPLVAGTRVRAARYGEIDRTDVLVLATDAEAPVYRRGDFPASLVVSLGADTDSQSELDPELAQGAKLYVDHPHSALCGDLKRWIAAGLAQARELRSFLDVRSETGPGDHDKVFVSTGSALFDNLTVAYYLVHESSPRASGG